MEEKNRANGSENAETSEAIEGIRRRPGSLKRKSNPFSSTTPSKRLSRTAVLPPIHNGPCTRARQSPNKAAVAAAAAAAVVPAAEAPPQLPAPVKEVSAGSEPNREDEDRQAAADSVTELEFEGIRTRGVDAHVVPAPAGWFSWTKVHPLEERALASFFNGKFENRTSDIYLEIRNSIMKKYHSDPPTQIALADLTELPSGDSNAREEVMEFLDHWGLINFHPFPPSDTSAQKIIGNADTDSPLEKFYKFEKVEAFPRIGPKRDSSTPAMPPRLLPESTVPDDMVRPPEGPAVEYHCNSCSADCSRKRYHCQKQADFDLCSECYNEGKFGSGMVPTDFILMEPGTEIPGASGGSWSDQETLLLLEALELYGENWSEIAEHVATKTKSQCILHFAQMPIEDVFLEGKEPFDGSVPENSDLGPDKDPSAPKAVPGSPTAKGASTEEQGPVSLTNDVGTPKEAAKVELAQENDVSFAANALKTAFHAVGALPRPGGTLSFAEAGNPVMALVAFLAALVDPTMAAASARSSLKAMSEDLPGIQLATRHCFLLDDPPNDQKDPPACESITNKENGTTEKEENQKLDTKCDDASNDVDDKNASPKNVTDMNIEISASEDVADHNVESGGSKDVTDKNLECGVTKDATDKNDEGPASKDVTVKNDENAMPMDITDKNDESAAPMDITDKNDEGATSKDVDDRNEENVATEDDMDKKDEIAVPTEKDAQVSADKSVEKSEEVIKSEELSSAGEVQPTPEMAKSMEIAADPVLSEGQGLQQTVVPKPTVEGGENIQQKVVSKPTVEGGENIGEDVKKPIDNTIEKTDSTTETKEDRNLYRMKRAALAALSAAAVKAKLLAIQEEEQIQQLVQLIIEKQFRKLETKLGMFTEVESVIMRMREQIDRAKQRLYNERAQIIASRLGSSASMSRAQPPSSSSSLPPNKISMNYANTGASRPPVTIVSSSTTGTPSLVFGQDGLPSVKTTVGSESKG